MTWDIGQRVPGRMRRLRRDHVQMEVPGMGLRTAHAWLLAPELDTLVEPERADALNGIRDAWKLPAPEPGFSPESVNRWSRWVITGEPRNGAPVAWVDRAQGFWGNAVLDGDLVVGSAGEPGTLTDGHQFVHYVGRLEPIAGGRWRLVPHMICRFGHDVGLVQHHIERFAVESKPGEVTITNDTAGFHRTYHCGHRTCGVEVPLPFGVTVHQQERRFFDPERTSIARPVEL